MKKNLQIEDGIYIKFEDSKFDLHNSHELSGIEFNVRNDYLKLLWKKYQEE